MMNTEDGFDFVDVAQTEQKDAGKKDKVNLIPGECFMVDTNPDGSKKFTCKQCNKECKSEVSVKQHIKAMHKSLKRTAPKSENASRKYLKKAARLDDFDLDSQVGAGDWTAAFCQDYLDEEELAEKTFGLDQSVENLVNNRKPLLHSTAISDNDDEFLQPDQDHDYIGKQEEEIQLLKAKVISLEISGMKKDTIINEKKNAKTKKDTSHHSDQSVKMC